MGLMHEVYPSMVPQTNLRMKAVEEKYRRRPRPNDEEFRIVANLYIKMLERLIFEPEDRWRKMALPLKLLLLIPPFSLYRLWSIETAIGRQKAVDLLEAEMNEVRSRNKELEGQMIRNTRLADYHQRQGVTLFRVPRVTPNRHELKRGKSHDISREANSFKPIVPEHFRLFEAKFPQYATFYTTFAHRALQTLAFFERKQKPFLTTTPFDTKPELAIDDYVEAMSLRRGSSEVIDFIIGFGDVLAAETEENTIFLIQRKLDQIADKAQKNLRDFASNRGFAFPSCAPHQYDLEEMYYNLSSTGFKMALVANTGDFPLGFINIYNFHRNITSRLDQITPSST